MNDNKKKKLNIVIVIMLAAAVAAVAVPFVRFFIQVLEEDGNETALYSAIMIYGMVAIVALVAVAAFLGIANASVKGPAALIVLVFIGCGAAMWFGVKNTTEKTDPDMTPRPTVTPPEVEIIRTERTNYNPETGTVFYRRYGNENASVYIENNSTSDAYFNMLDKGNLVVLIFYVRAGEACSVTVPTGTYIFQCATGKDWEDDETYFGEKTHFRKLPDEYVFYNGDTTGITLTAGLPEMENIKQKDFVVRTYW